MTPSEKSAMKKLEYDLVVADGGWGYLICVSAVIVFLIGTGFIPCFGLIFKEPIEEIGITTTDITLLNGIYALSFAFLGFLTSTFLNYLSKRQLSFIAITMFNCGNIMAIFINSRIPFFLMYILQGCGFGILFNLTLGLVNEYFEEKRLFASSLIQTAQASLMLVLPQFVNFFHDLYGYKGLMLIISGVGFQGFVAVALMQPGEWHMKKVPKRVATEEAQVQLIDDGNEPTVKLNDNIEAFEQIPEELQIKEFTGKTSWVKTFFKDMFDIPVIVNMMKTNVSWGIAFSGFIDGTFIIMLPQALTRYGWDANYVALAITLSTFGDLAGRIFFTVASKWIKIGNQELFLFGHLLLALLVRIGFLFTSSNTRVALVFITMIGVARCFMVLFFPLLIADIVEPNKFSAAMGFTMVLVGLFTLGLGFVAGAIRDYTDSYDVMFWCITGLNAAVFISWTVEYVYKRIRSRRKKALN